LYFARVAKPYMVMAGVVGAGLAAALAAQKS
jgi:hypothetical protein